VTVPPGFFVVRATLAAVGWLLVRLSITPPARLPRAAATNSPEIAQDSSEARKTAMVATSEASTMRQTAFSRGASGVKSCRSASSRNTTSWVAREQRSAPAYLMLKSCIRSSSMTVSIGPVAVAEPPAAAGHDRVLGLQSEGVGILTPWRRDRASRRIVRAEGPWCKSCQALDEVWKVV